MDPQSVKDIIRNAGIALAAISVWLGMYYLGRLREKSMLRNWAEKNRFQLVSFRQRRFFESAPFSFLTSHRQPAYFITVRDERGKERSAWVRLGTLWGSVWSNTVEVEWNEKREAL
jgi:hypothetical protein